MTLYLPEEVAVFLEEAFGNPDEVPEGNLEPQLGRAYVSFIKTICRAKSVESCLRSWSKLIRTRDAHRCVLCRRTSSLTAHHICRKSFLPFARLQTGNGITLCRKCHREVHAGFNGKPDLGQPMDAQGGEKIETMLQLYGALLQDAREQGLLSDQMYFLSDSVLRTFKKAQSFDPKTQFAGTRLEQAYRIWRACPQSTLRAVLAANGFPMLPTEVFTGLPSEEKADKSRWISTSDYLAYCVDQPDLDR